MTTKLTVVCREADYESDILLYAVDVENPGDAKEVQKAVQDERNADLGNVAGEMEILFAFAGDLNPVQDWRD